MTEFHAMICGSPTFVFRRKIESPREEIARVINKKSKEIAEEIINHVEKNSTKAFSTIAMKYDEEEVIQIARILTKIYEEMKGEIYITSEGFPFSIKREDGKEKWGVECFPYTRNTGHRSERNIALSGDKEACEKIGGIFIDEGYSVGIANKSGTESIIGTELKEGMRGFSFFGRGDMAHIHIITMKHNK